MRKSLACLIALTITACATAHAPEESERFGAVSLNDVFTRSCAVRLAGSIGSRRLEPGSCVRASADVDVYIDPDTDVCDDDAAGTSVAPVCTWAAARTLTPIDDAGHAVTWHLAGGTHEVAEIPSSVVRVYGDAAWDAGARTTVATLSAASGTSASQVVTSGGLTANAHRGLWLYHSSTGQIRLIAENDATTLYPTAAFSPAPAEGDAVLVLESAVVLSTPDSDAVMLWQSSKDRTLEGVKVSSTGTMRIIGGTTRLMGVDIAVGSFTVTDEVACGFDRVTTSLIMGWGAYVRSGATLRFNGFATGHVVQMGTIRSTARAELDGHFDSVDAYDNAHFRGVTIIGGNSGGRTTIGDASSASVRVRVFSRGNLTVRQATVRGSLSTALILAEGTGNLHLAGVTANNASGPTLRAQYGGRVTIGGDPTAIGDGGSDDIQIDDLSVANTAFSTLETAYQLSGHGSSVQRAQ